MTAVKPSPDLGERSWLRQNVFCQKYDVAASTVGKWAAQGLVDTRKIGRVKYIKDKLPEPVDQS